jgi:putative transcriptional regulator
MVDILENKRAATRFRILVEIADRQPAVSQGEIADAVGVTSQAVSEYIRDLVKDGFVDKEGRSRYRVTKEGVDWLFQAATDVRRFSDHVTEDVLGNVQEDAAIATDDIAEGAAVSLSLADGLLHASPDDEGTATGVATTDAAAGDVVGVTGFEGVIDLEPGTVHIVQVPPIRSSTVTKPPDLAAICDDADLVCAAGVEAVAALRDDGVDVDVRFAPGEVAAAAAGRGLDVTVVATADSVGRVTDALRDTDISYEVT